MLISTSRRAPNLRRAQQVLRGLLRLSCTGAAQTAMLEVVGAISHGTVLKWVGLESTSWKLGNLGIWWFHKIFGYAWNSASIDLESLNSSSGKGSHLQDWSKGNGGPWTGSSDQLRVKFYAANDKHKLQHNQKIPVLQKHTNTIKNLFPKFLHFNYIIILNILKLAIIHDKDQIVRQTEPPAALHALLASTSALPPRWE